MNMVGSAGKPKSAYEDGGGAFSSGGGAFNDGGGAVRDGGGAAGPNRPDSNRESTKPSVDGKFENPFEEQSPANRVSFRTQVGEIKARAAKAGEKGNPNFGVDPETGEFTSWREALDSQYMPLGDPEQLTEDGTFANRENDPLPSSAAQATLDLSMQGPDKPSDSGESDGDVASVDSSSEGGDENV